MPHNLNYKRFRENPKVYLLALLAVALIQLTACSGLDQEIMKTLGGGGKNAAASGPLSLATIIDGLKEALSVGTESAVDVVSKAGGYFKNPDIKIPMPQKLVEMTDLLSKFGFGEQVDKFVGSMNQAAEAAAPQATALFLDSIKTMTFADAKKILYGADTAGTDYLKSKTYDRLAADFESRVSAKMDSVGVTQAYKEISNVYNRIPLSKPVALDLDGYVTDKALDGLFFMVAEEEKKIRKDPAARVTSLLQKVFGASAKS